MDQNMQGKSKKKPRGCSHGALVALVGALMGGLVGPLVDPLARTLVDPFVVN